MNEPQLPVLNPNTYVKESALALWEGLPKIILAGVMFTLISLPTVLLELMGFLIPGILVGVFTVGPAWAALCKQIHRIIYREPAGILPFLQSLRDFYGRGALLAGLLAVPLVAAGLTLPILLAPPVPTIVWVGLAADLAGLFLLVTLYLYAYPLLVIYDVPVTVALRNSLLLAARYLSNTLGLLGLAALLLLLATNLTLFLLVLLPAFWLVFVVNNCRMVVEMETGEAE